MAFFPRSSYGNANASFTPLFRLLEDFDSYSRQGQGLPQWQPKFDVRETNEAYELHGELPGIAKENVHIDFTEPQTILIRGKTERTYTSGTPPAGFVEDKSVGTTAIEGSETHSTSSHKATVEDEFESVAHETRSDAEAAGTPKEVQQAKPAQKQPADKSKYWLTERSIGEFSRSFNFPTRVDQDAVTANFQDGILTIVVPKAKKHESRRITVN
ncbi:hypothetical protein QQX98_002416 [Neonectria punicea]|uniref:SHSP domain-containing protein n=1 Tax=Neonectria punicea TaxID=979145 RepID=A0ABR1HIP4_9HYPO